jgi:hypothetical protein
MPRDWLSGERGASLARLGLAEGRETLSVAVERVGPERSKDRPWLLLALARSHLTGADPVPEKAARLVTQVVTEATTISVPIINEIKATAEQVKLWPSHRLVSQEIIEQLHLAVAQFRGSQP